MAQRDCLTTFVLAIIGMMLVAGAMLFVFLLGFQTFMIMNMSTTQGLIVCLLFMFFAWPLVFICAAD